MRMFDVISKKKYGEVLSKEEIEYVVREYTNGTIPDYQMSAFLMAVYFKGMSYKRPSSLLWLWQIVATGLICQL